MKDIKVGDLVFYHRSIHGLDKINQLNNRDKIVQGVGIVMGIGYVEKNSSRRPYPLATYS